MKLIIKNSKIAGIATDEYYGPDYYIEQPENFNLELISEYMFINNRLQLPIEYWQTQVEKAGMTLEFKITNMDRQITDGFVTTVYWTVSLTDGIYSSSRNSQTVFNQKDDINYIPYDQLTETLVIDWIKNSLSSYNINTIKECLFEDIAKQKVPPVIAGIPWNSN